MNRRAVLAGLGAAAAGVPGCVSVGSEDPTGTATRTPPVCDSPGESEIELVGTKELPEQLNVSMSASVERARPTADEPARLRVTLRNEGAERAVAFPDDSSCHPFNRDQRFSDPRGVTLYYHTDTPDERVSSCWTRDFPPMDRNPGWDGYGCPQSSIGSGESVDYSLEIWDDFRIDGYMPTGTYRFETALLTFPEFDSTRWWLELSVTNPDQ